MLAPVFLIAAVFMAVTTNNCEASCGGQIPAEPQPGGYQAISIPVNDANLGTVTRTFGIYIPEDYSANTELPLVMFFHGSGGQGSINCGRGWCAISERDPDGPFIVVQADGVDGVWNSSKTDGPLGPPCKLPKPLSEFNSSKCSYVNSCDIYYGNETTCQDRYQFTCERRGCYDEEAFIRAMVDYVGDNYCLNANSVHMTGSSNGGMLTYSSLTKLNDIVATFGIVAASPILGFPDNIPLDPPVSIIDFHGLYDTTFPYSLTIPYGENGVSGPYNSVLTPWHFYVMQKQNWLRFYKQRMGCTFAGAYPTMMDNAEGWDGWSCSVLSNCLGGNEFVACTGNYGHGPPFKDLPTSHVHNKIMWDFMKRHARTGN